MMDHPAMTPPTPQPSAVTALLGETEMGRRVRGLDWSSTPLGPIEGWPQSLLIAIGVCLNSRFPMFVWWGKELINIYNDGYIPMLGARHPAALGKPARDAWEDIWVDVGPQADLVMNEGKATWNERVHLRMQRNGFWEDTWFTWSYSPIRDDQGKICGLYCAVQEDTPRVLAERERDASEAALKEADRRKDEFLAMLAHELRNPLAPLSNALYTLRMHPDADTTRSAHDMMDRQLRQMVRLVDDLLDVSRITSGKVALQKEPARLSEIIQAAVESVKPLVDARRQALSVDLGPGAWLDADKARLSQVFANILNNASKFTPAGGRIELAARASAEGVTIEVRDTGRGIPVDQLTSIFDIFAQVDHGIERAHGGLGIGLTIVKSMVEMHGGRVEALSDGPGTGATLRVQLPTRAPVRVAVTEEQPSIAAGAGLKLLVVDDNRDAAQSLGMMLELLGHQVQLEYDGPAALRAVERFTPDAVFLDIGLPGMSGFDVCRQLRGSAPADELVLIAQTGWGDPVQRSRSREAGFDHHLVKPLDVAILRTLLSDIAQRPR
jgi:signal transduction histidine kinase